VPRRAQRWNGNLESGILTDSLPATKIGIEVSALDMYDANRAHIIPYFQSAAAQMTSSPSSPSYIDLPLIGAARFTGVPGSAEEVPATFVLSQNYPNPFNPSTTIAFTLPNDQNVVLEVFAVTGQRIATLVQGMVPGWASCAVPRPWSGQRDVCSALNGRIDVPRSQDAARPVVFGQPDLH
jgi:hypothetical protein